MELTRQITQIDRRELGRLSNRTESLEGRYSYLMMRFKGKPTAGASEAHAFAEPLVFAAASCTARAKTAATGTAVWGLKLEGVSVGSITFAPGDLFGVVSCSLEQIPEHQDFEVVAPSPQDATLADVTLAFALQR